MAIQSTTSTALEAAAIDLIRQITPSHPSHRATGWVPAPDNREVGGSSEVPRMFRIAVVSGDTVEGGLTGNGDTETELAVDVLADYRAFDPNERGDVVERDQWDLHDALHDAIGTIPGLTHVELAGEPLPDGDDEAARFRFPFTVHYMRARN